LSGIGVLVYAENYSGRVHQASFELLWKASQLKEKLAGSVLALLPATGSWSDVARDLVACGADKVLVYEVNGVELLANQLLHVHALAEAVEEYKPRLVLVPATPWGRSVAPRLAARLRSGATADCLDVYVDESGDIVQVRPAFTGNIIVHVKTSTQPAIATIRPGVFPRPKPDYNRVGEVLVRRVKYAEIPREVFRVKVKGVVKQKEVRLSDARVIVAVGRGLKRREDLALFEELARELGGVLACSRPLVDAGWVDRDRQVGFSGNVVRPRVYIACGISGAPQHVAGMKDSEFVIAINIDESAPMSKYSDVFVVGDMYRLVPLLIAKIRESARKGSRGG